jgi:beta-lactamase regulating signal transducer with metallopeptidase domain
MTATQFLELALSLSIQAVFVVVATRWLCGRTRNVTTQCRLWTACHVILLLLVLAGVLLPHRRLIHPWSGLDEEAAVGLAVLESNLGQILFLAWGIGAAAALLLFLAGSILSYRSLNRCRPIDPTLVSQADDATASDADSMRRPQPVRFLTGPDVASPCCWQFHVPCILLPSFVLELSRRDREFVIRHELEHVRRGHPLQLFLQRAVGIVFWFHPVVWWAAYQTALVREFACDEAAVQDRAEIADYLRTLLKVVEQTTARSGTPGMLAFGIGAGIVASRARRLARQARCGDASESSLRLRRTLLPALAACAVLALFLRLPVDVLASPRSAWSPWPTWSASLLHDFDIPVRDFELYDSRSRIQELAEDD